MNHCKKLRDIIRSEWWKEVQNSIFIDFSIIDTEAEFALGPPNERGGKAYVQEAAFLLQLVQNCSSISCVFQKGNNASDKRLGWLVCIFHGSFREIKPFSWHGVAGKKA